MKRKDVDPKFDPKYRNIWCMANSEGLARHKMFELARDEFWETLDIRVLFRKRI